MAIGRNDPCPCGSGKKYKKCCINKEKRGAVNKVPELLVSIKSLAQNNKPTAALNKCIEALKLDPGHPELNLITGKLYVQAGRPDMAEKCLRRVIEKQPNSIEALRILGVILNQNGKPDEGLSIMKRAYKLAPDNKEILTNYAALIINTDDFNEAESLILKAADANPESGNVQFNLARLYKKQLRHREAVDTYKKSIELDPNNYTHKDALIRAIDYCPNLLPEESFEVFRETGEFIEKNYPVLFDDYSTNDKLRIGYLGTSLRQHSVAHFLLPILSSHSDKVEVYCYHIGEKEDQVTEKIKRLSKGYKHIHNYSSEKAAREIYSDGIDILFDLDGYTSSISLQVLSHQPAPIQIAWIGYPDTTGMSRIQYRIVDNTTDPTDSIADSIHTEKLIRMPKGFSIYSPPEETPEVSATPALENGYVTFGSFNETAKLNTDVVSLWSQVLKAIPSAKLMLKHFNFDKASMRECVKDMFREHGITSEQLILKGMDETTMDHLKRYHEIDIALDPFPFNGATTSCESLWMGVPVLTLAGTKHMSRVTASLLSNIGHPEFIATDSEQFVEIAKSFASDIQSLNTTRLRLREDMANSSLMDASSFTETLEEKLLELSQEAL